MLREKSPRVGFIKESELLISEEEVRSLPSVRDQWAEQAMAWVVEDYEPIDASRPASFPPGSVEKVRVMVTRARIGESLWHKDDAPFGGICETEEYPKYSSDEIAEMESAFESYIEKYTAIGEMKRQCAISKRNTATKKTKASGKTASSTIKTSRTGRHK